MIPRREMQASFMNDETMPYVGTSRAHHNVIGCTCCACWMGEVASFTGDGSISHAKNLALQEKMFI